MEKIKDESRIISYVSLLEWKSLKDEKSHENNKQINGGGKNDQQLQMHMLSIFQEDNSSITIFWIT